MGYDLHITRAPTWTDSKSHPIPLNEWLKYVAGDPEMRLDNFAEAQVDGGILRYENEGLAVWTAYSKSSEAGAHGCWFDHRRGEVVVKGPDEEIIGKMKRIAQALGARVVGDEGELY